MQEKTGATDKELLSDLLEDDVTLALSNLDGSLQVELTQHPEDSRAHLLLSSMVTLLRAGEMTRATFVGLLTLCEAAGAAMFEKHPRGDVQMQLLRNTLDVGEACGYVHRAAVN